MQSLNPFLKQRDPGDKRHPLLIVSPLLIQMSPDSLKLLLKFCTLNNQLFKSFTSSHFYIEEHYSYIVLQFAHAVLCLRGEEKGERN